MPSKYTSFSFDMRRFFDLFFIDMRQVNLAEITIRYRSYVKEIYTPMVRVGHAPCMGGYPNFMESNEIIVGH